MGYVLGVDLGTTFTAAAIHRDGRFDPVSCWPMAARSSRRSLLREGGRHVRLRRRRQPPGAPATRAGWHERSSAGSATRRRSCSADRRTRRTASPLGCCSGWSTGCAPLEGGPPDRIALTHPASWRGFKLDLLRQAVQHTGLGTEFECLTVSEPHAAAIWYSSQSPLTDDQLVAVYDLGGGTFDAAVLRQHVERLRHARRAAGHRAARRARPRRRRVPPRRRHARPRPRRGRPRGRSGDQRAAATAGRLHRGQGGAVRGHARRRSTSRSRAAHRGATHAGRARVHGPTAARRHRGRARTGTSQRQASRRATSNGSCSSAEPSRMPLVAEVVAAAVERPVALDPRPSSPWPSAPPDRGPSGGRGRAVGGGAGGRDPHRADYGGPHRRAPAGSAADGAAFRAGHSPVATDPDAGGPTGGRLDLAGVPQRLRAGHPPASPGMRRGPPAGPTEGTAAHPAGHRRRPPDADPRRAPRPPAASPTRWRDRGARRPRGSDRGGRSGGGVHRRWRRVRGRRPIAPVHGPTHDGRGRPRRQWPGRRATARPRDPHNPTRRPTRAVITRARGVLTTGSSGSRSGSTLRGRPQWRPRRRRPAGRSC